MPREVRLSDQIREAIERCGMSRYEIAKRLDIEQSALSRFMSGERGLRLETLDRLGVLLGLRLVKDHRGKEQKS